MATLPITGIWSSAADLTGNSCYVFDAPRNLIWMVGENTAALGGATLFQSEWLGFGFVIVATIPAPPNTIVAFDPAIALDAQGNIHIIGQQIGSTGAVEVQKYWWDRANSVMNGPFPLTTGGLIGSDYDIVALTNGNCYCVVSVINQQTEYLVGIEIAADGTIVATDTLANEAFTLGVRYGAVSLWTPDGVATEVYCHVHTKKLAFGSGGMTLMFQTLTRQGADTFGSWTTLTTLQVTHTDNRLTVIGNGNARYLTECFYTQTRGKLTASIFLGGNNGTGWAFTSINGTVAQSLVEPVLSISPGGLVLAYLTKDLTNLNFQDGPISIYTVDPVSWLVSPRLDFPYGTSATYLRGSKSMLDPSMPWGMVAQQSSGNAIFYTGYNAPPVTVVSPNAIDPAVRGVTYEFDASGSYSLNLDPLSYFWTLTDPTQQATFTTAGAIANLTVPDSIGPNAWTLTVNCAVTAWDPVGLNPLHSPASQSITVAYPAVAPPVIVAVAGLPAARNTTIQFMPTVQYNGGALAHYWLQVGGTGVTVTSRPTSVLLIFSTQGAMIAGETLTFQLQVSDNINQPVYQDFNFNVAARVAGYQETGSLMRTTFQGTVAQRNQQTGWSSPAALNQTTNFTTGKRATLFNGGAVYLLISPGSVIANSTLTYTVFLPDTTATILDAVHSDADYTVTLSSTQLLQVFFPTPAGATDYARITIDIGALDEGTFTTLQVTPSYAGARVFTLTGPNGVLMLEILIATWTIIGVLKLDQESGLLYGADLVTYCRTSNVESLRSGQVLVGTTSPDGQPYETLVDMRTRSIVNTFDVSNLRSTRITTGERLFAPDDSYAGTPLAPVLVSAVQVNGQAVLSWTQTRSDLVSGYNILASPTYQGAVENQTYAVLATVSSGLTLTATISNLSSGVSYAFVVEAQSLDGPSPYSNAVSVSF